jgi:hypothetical protein
MLTDTGMRAAELAGLSRPHRGGTNTSVKQIKRTGRDYRNAANQGGRILLASAASDDNVNIPVSGTVHQEPRRVPFLGGRRHVDAIGYQSTTGLAVGFGSDCQVPCSWLQPIQVHSAPFLREGNRQQRHQGDDHDEDPDRQVVVVVSHEQGRRNQWGRATYHRRADLVSE